MAGNFSFLRAISSGSSKSASRLITSQLSLEFLSLGNSENPIITLVSLDNAEVKRGLVVIVSIFGDYDQLKNRM